MGCSKVTDSSQLYGTYEARHEAGVETLKLNPDGTYTHFFKATDQTESSHSDKWNFEPYNGDPKVSLQNFSAHFPQSSHGPGVTLLGIERELGKTRLYLNYDRGEFYSKTR